MAGATTIKEFLVGLGFNINQNQYKQFIGGIDGATLAVGKLATAVEATAAAVVIGVTKIAERFEDLYYASKRIGTTVQNIESLEFAARQIGVAGGEATAALENLASMMRTQPGTEGLLNSMGVQTRDASHAMRDMNDIQQDFVKRLREMPYFMAAQFAQMFGISERTLYQLINRQDEAIQKQEEYRKKVREWGLDLDDVASKSRDFMNRLRDVAADFDLLATKIQRDLMPVADRMLQVMQHLFELFRSSQSAFAPFQAALGSVVTTLEAIIAILESRWEDAWKKAGQAVRENLNILGPRALPLEEQRRIEDQMRPGTGDTIFGRILRGLGLAPQSGGAQAGSAAPTGGEAPTAGEAIMNFFKNMGWSQAQAAGIAGNLQQESGFDPAASGDGGRAYGVAQWHPDRQAAFQQWAGKPMQGSSLWEQLAFIQHELTEGAERTAGNLLRSAKTAAEAAGVFSQNYERPADVQGEMARRGAMAEHLLEGGTNVTVNQKTDIHVNGGDAPATTGRAVADEQRRVNADMTRNLAGAVR
jgi:hypothetical protein